MAAALLAQVVPSDAETTCRAVGRALKVVADCKPCWTSAMMCFALGIAEALMMVRAGGGRLYGPRVAHVSAQSQCTYTAVRGSANPRFATLPGEE